MKRILPCLLIAILCLTCLVSCNSVVKNKYFSQELLERTGLEDMPIPPSVDNSRLQFGMILYLNITEEEYESFVEEVKAYIKGREDIVYLGYSVGQYLEGEMLPYDEIAPVSDKYWERKDLDIFFSTERELSGRDGKNLINPVEIKIVRKEGKLAKTNFEYNTFIAIFDGVRACAKWNLCGAEHTYNEGKEYKIAGSIKTITEYTCVNCGSTKFSDYISDLKPPYKITIVDTEYDHYLYTRPKESYAGQIVSINAMKIIDADFKVTANGTELLPQETQYDDMWRYEFIMPREDVVIMTEIVGDGPTLEETVE